MNLSVERRRAWQGGGRQRARVEDCNNEDDDQGKEGVGRKVINKRRAANMTVKVTVMTAIVLRCMAVMLTVTATHSIRRQQTEATMMNASDKIASK